MSGDADKGVLESERRPRRSGKTIALFEFLTLLVAASLSCQGGTEDARTLVHGTKAESPSDVFRQCMSIPSNIHEVVRCRKVTVIVDRDRLDAPTPGELIRSISTGLGPDMSVETEETSLLLGGHTEPALYFVIRHPGERRTISKEGWALRFPERGPNEARTVLCMSEEGGDAQSRCLEFLDYLADKPLPTSVMRPFEPAPAKVLGRRLELPGDCENISPSEHAIRLTCPDAQLMVMKIEPAGRADSKRIVEHYRRYAISTFGLINLTPTGETAVPCLLMGNNAQCERARTIDATQHIYETWVGIHRAGGQSYMIACQVPETSSLSHPLCNGLIQSHRDASTRPGNETTADALPRTTPQPPKEASPSSNEDAEPAQ